MYTDLTPSSSFYPCLHKTKPSLETAPRPPPLHAPLHHHHLFLCGPTSLEYSLARWKLIGFLCCFGGFYIDVPRPISSLAVIWKVCVGREVELVGRVECCEGLNGPVCPCIAVTTLRRWRTRSSSGRWMPSMLYCIHGQIISMYLFSMCIIWLHPEGNVIDANISLELPIKLFNLFDPQHHPRPHSQLLNS